MALPGAVTAPDRVVGQEVQYTVDGAEISAYLARPSAPGTYPGVIVIHEAFGPVEHIFDVVRRFANQGYIALAPNLYSRVGAPDPSNMDEVFKKMLGLPDDQIVRDLEGAAAFVRQQAGADGKVGIIGFCSGGRQTLLAACRSSVFDAAVDCWGGFIRTATPSEKVTRERPVPVIDMAGNVSCPVMVVIGAEDQNPSPLDGEMLVERLKASGKPHRVKVYQNAGHAFFADYRPTYREQAAFELWDDATRFLAEHLKN